MSHAILLISCKDRKGITSAVTSYVFRNHGNIVHAEQHIDEQTNTFFMRIEWSLEGFRFVRDKIRESFKPVAHKFDMQWNLYFSDEIPRVAIFVSKHLHCLYDLLLRHRSGQFRCEIPLIISNHTEASSIAHQFGTRYYEFPITPRNKRAQEKKQAELLKKEGVEMIILARYHQILSGSFVAKFTNRIINIHHSFLPAFVGPKPYDQAYRQGVKLIGATSHFVIPQLDAGPIIEQDTVRISHRDSVEDLKRKGQDLEELVLSRAVRGYLERKILAYGNKTVIFD